MGKNKMIIYMPERIFFGGDIVLGVIELNLQTKIKSRGVRMLLSGNEEVRFTVQNGQNSSTTYHEKWIFLQYRMDLAGAPREHRKKAEVEVIPPGVYRWPFAFKLPDFLPPTSRFPFGWCRYRISAYVDIPMGFDLTRKQDFVVGGLIYNPYEYISPKPLPELQKNDKGFFFAKGKMNMTVQLERENFFVGDTIRVKLTVENKSKKPVDRIKLTLMDEIQCWACGRVRQWGTNLHRQKYNHKIRPKSTETFDLEFIVPDLRHTSAIPNPNHLGKLVQVRFAIWVRLDIPWAIDLKCVNWISIMQRDPKAIHLPPPGPLIAPTGKRWLEMPPLTTTVVASAVPISPTFAQPIMYYPEISGYNFPIETAVVGLEMGDYKMEDDEAFLLD